MFSFKRPGITLKTGQNALL